jgi:hypothetical protein
LWENTPRYTAVITPKKIAVPKQYAEATAMSMNTLIALPGSAKAVLQE